MRLRPLAAFAFAAAALPALAAPPVSGEMVGRIADEGFNHGQIVETIEYLADQIGGRMTNSPAMRKAEDWTSGKFREWGLANVHKEGFEFGRGWWIESASVRQIAPRPIMLRSIPVAWTPATNGPVTAEIIVAPMRREADFARWKGKLSGKIVLVTAPTDPRDAEQPPFVRLNDQQIAQRDSYPQPSYDPAAAERNSRRRQFAAKLDAFLKAEGALAWARMSYRENSLVTGEGSAYKVGATPALPGVEIAAEDYRRLARLAKVGPVRIEITSNVHFDDSDSKAYNIIAEIPGSNPKAGYVMAGAHLDSWVAADGAADNGAGSAMIMEAARILAATGVKPKRTIRFALWAGEEEGLLGSAAYVAQHFATRPAESDPAKAAAGPAFANDTWPVTTLPGYRELAGYFNIDNGSGKLRGIYTEGNFGVVPIFKEWLAPFGPMGASAVVAQTTGGTDHVLMARLGLPAFQFIQDPLDYGSTVHHSNVDTFDHLRPNDMRQAAVILATMLLDAANADQPLPRNPLPTKPVATNPYAADVGDDQ